MNEYRRLAQDELVGALERYMQRVPDNAPFLDVMTAWMETIHHVNFAMQAAGETMRDALTPPSAR